MNEITVSAPEWFGDRAPLIKALVAAQLTSEAVLKAATNPAFRSRYADLAAVVEAVVPALNRAGVAVIQVPSNDGDLVTVTTILAHESGATLTGSLGMRPTKADPQGVGSAVTYARRYALLAMTGAAPEDDDGNHASRAVPAAERPTPPPSQTGPSAFVTASRNAIRALKTVAACDKWYKENVSALREASEADRNSVILDLKVRKDGIKAQPVPYDDPIPFGDDNREAA